MKRKEETIKLVLYGFGEDMHEGVVSQQWNNIAVPSMIFSHISLMFSS